MQRRTVLIVAFACLLLVHLVMRYGASNEEVPQVPAADEARAARVEPDRVDARVVPAEAETVGAVEAADAASSGAFSDPAMTRLHAELLGMRVAARDSFLRLAIRDAKFPCESVNSTSALPEAPVWRVSCAGAHFYMIRIDEFQDMHVEPILWDAIAPPVSGPLDRPPVRTLELVPAPVQPPQQ